MLEKITDYTTLNPGDLIGVFSDHYWYCPPSIGLGTFISISTSTDTPILFYFGTCRVTRSSPFPSENIEQTRMCALSDAVTIFKISPEDILLLRALLPT